MNRLFKFFLVLFLLAVFLFLQAFPYLNPPLSIQECKKIPSSTYDSSGIFNIFSDSNSQDIDGCIKSVAIIRGDKHLCKYLTSNAQRYCIEAIEEIPRPDEWKLTKDIRIDNYYSDYSYLDFIDPVARCGVHGLMHNNVVYSKNYFRNYVSFSYQDVAFVSDCEKILKNTNESFCNNHSEIKNYQKDICLANIRLAKGFADSKDYAILHNDSSACPRQYGDICYSAIAIKINNLELCKNTKSNYSSSANTNCWFYFALKNSNMQYCDNINSEKDRYYCRAVLLAEQGS